MPFRSADEEMRRDVRGADGERQPGVDRRPRGHRRHVQSAEVAEDFTFVSTAGGAFLERMEG